MSVHADMPNTRSNRRPDSGAADSRSQREKRDADQTGQALAPAHALTGICECGCGEPTKLATRTQAAKGHVKGQPQRFILGHRIRLNSAKLNRDRATPWRERVTENARRCLVWSGATNSRGYGQIGRKLAHRHVWEEQHGPIPGDLTIDHLCREKRCLNTKHMELVTRAENTRRRWMTGLVVVRGAAS